MKDRKLASRYARALLAALPDPSSQNAADVVLRSLAKAIETDPAVRAALVDPAIPAAAKTKLLQSVATAMQAPARVASFLATVVAHGRMANLSSIAGVYREELERAQGIVSGTLTTAAPIGDELAQRAAAALTRLTGRRVQLELKIDPELLGGAVAQVGSMVYDGSVKTQLGRLRRRIGED
jgi:F-type H+-transporting ATPase subunit delta